jgi:hypothetical protein
MGGGGGMNFLFIIRYNEIVPTYLLFHYASMLRIIGMVRFICMLCLFAIGNLVFLDILGLYFRAPGLVKMGFQFFCFVCPVQGFFWFYTTTIRSFCMYPRGGITQLPGTASGSEWKKNFLVP